MRAFLLRPARHLLSLAFLAAAFVAYIASVGSGIQGALFLVGVALEVVFWSRVRPAGKPQLGASGR